MSNLQSFEKNGKHQVIGGAFLSYILIILNAMYGFIVFPFILSKIGQSEYGVYKIVTSFTTALMIMDLGISSTIQRFIAKFIAEKNKERLENYLAMMLIQLLILLIFVGSIGFLLYSSVSNLFDFSFTLEEISKANQLYILLIFSLLLTIVSNFLSGIVTGFNKFIFVNLINVIFLFLKVILIVLILSKYKNSVILVYIDIFINVLSILFKSIYLKKNLSINIHFVKFDKSLFKESLIYMFLMFLSAIINQVNGNLDNVVIGAIIGSSAVAIYSFSIVIESAFEKFAVAISKVMLPTVVNQIEQGDSLEKLEDTVIKVGRLQFMLCGAILAGFIVIGKEFIVLWLGKEYLDIWLISLIIMIPRLVELIENVYLSILRAKNKIGFRTIGLFCMTLVNLLITIVGTRLWGYIAAAIGTSLSIIVFELIIMNYYYYKMDLHPLRTILKIVDKIIFCIIVPSFVVYFTKNFFIDGWISLIIQIIIFMIIYVILLLIFGLNMNEKLALSKVKKRLIKERK